MKLRNIKIDESIKSQFKKALEDEHTVIDPTTADALKNEEDVRKQINDEFKENDKAAEELVAATAPEEKKKVKDRKELTKLLSESNGRKYKISRCDEDGYRYFLEWIDEPKAEETEVLVENKENEAEAEPVVEEVETPVTEAEPLVEEQQPEQEPEVIEESKEPLVESNYDKIMKVLNDVEAESLEEEQHLNEKNDYSKKRDDKEQSIQLIVCNLYSKFSNEFRDNIYSLVANLMSDFPDAKEDEIQEKAEAAIVDETMDDYLDTGNTAYLDKNYHYEESLEEDKKGNIGKHTVGFAINANRNKIDGLAYAPKADMIKAVEEILSSEDIDDKEYAKKVIMNCNKKRTSSDILIYLYDIMLKQVGLGSPDAPKAEKEEPIEEESLQESVEDKLFLNQESFDVDNCEG